MSIRHCMMLIKNSVCFVPLVFKHFIPFEEASLLPRYSFIASGINEINCFLDSDWRFTGTGNFCIKVIAHVCGNGEANKFDLKLMFITCVLVCVSLQLSQVCFFHISNELFALVTLLDHCTHNR